MTFIGIIETEKPPGWRFVGPSPQVITVDSPAAGSDWGYTFPQDRLVSIGSVHGQLVTSTTAGTRNVKLRVYDSDTNILFSTPLGSTIAKTTTATITYARGLGSAYALGTQRVAGLPQLIIPPNCHIKTVTSVLAATDKWSAVRLMIELI